MVLKPHSSIDNTMVSIPHFSHTVIEGKRDDGYWVETFHFSSKESVPGVIASGLVSGRIEFLDNPIAAKQTGRPVDKDGQWKKYHIGQFDSPVAVIACDVNNNGLTDLIICHDYGPFMLQCNMQGGWVSWLENPGIENLGKGFWKERRIGRWPAMHRMKAGFFTQKSFLEVVAASVVHGEHDKTTPIPIIRFQAPENVMTATEWHREVIDDEHFTVIHELTTKKFNGDDGLDSMIVSSREGTTWLYFEKGIWKRELIGIGEPKEPRQSATSESPGSGDHWGTGSADAGKLGDDRFAYIATIDPFHGTAVCVYSKSNQGMKGAEWTRTVLDVYGTPNQLRKTGDGPGHYVVCADFDGDGEDEFLISLFGSLDRDPKGDSIEPNAGPNPNKGIMYYKVIDIEKNIFAKWRIADESSARIAIGNFAGTGRLDLISISYNVALYYEEPKPVVTLHLNQFGNVTPTLTASPIIPTVWDNEAMVYLSRPKDISASHTMPLLEIANYALSIEIHPKDSKVLVPDGHGIKVLYGTLRDTSGTSVRSSLGVAPFPVIAAITCKDPILMADRENGAIVLRIVPIGAPAEWRTALDVPVKTTFSTNKLGLKFPPLEFKKCEDLWWGSGFKGTDFWNLSGFYFRFQDDKTQLAHMQFWTAGTKVDCGVHNHSGDIFEEVHICLSPGSHGGMSRLIPVPGIPEDVLPPVEKQKFEHVQIPRLYEHGGMWYRDSYGRAIRRASGVVAYPWHKWQAGPEKNVDVWLALEFNPTLDV